MASTLGKHILISQCTVYENLISEFYRVCFKVFPPSVLFCDIITLLIMTNWNGSNEKTKRVRQKPERKREKKLCLHMWQSCAHLWEEGDMEKSPFSVCLTAYLHPRALERERERETSFTPAAEDESEPFFSIVSFHSLTLYVPCLQSLLLY